MGTVSGIAGVLDVAVVSGGTGGGSSAGAGATGSAVPADAVYNGFSVGGNLVGVSASNPLPVTAASLPLPTGASTSANQTSVQSSPGTSAATALTVQGSPSGVSLPVTDSTNYTTPDGRQVKVVSNAAILFSDDFGGTALSATKWDVLDGGLGLNPTLDGQSLTQSAIGSGTAMGSGGNVVTNTAITVSGSNLAIAMGTTSGAEFWLLSKQAFAGTEDLFFTFTKSQALAANSIEVGLVEVDPTTLIPLYNANTPSFTVNSQTVPAYFTNAGLVELGCQTSTTAYAVCAIGDSSGAGAVGNTGTALAAMTSASEFLVEYHAEDVIASNGAVDSTSAKNSFPARVSSQCPNDGKVYRLLIRLRNIGTPGSSTTVTFGRAMLWDSQELRVEVASGRGDANPQKGVPVNPTAVYNSSALTLTTGQAAPLQADPAGYLKINIAQTGVTIPVYSKTNANGGPSAARLASNAANAYGNLKSSGGQLYGYEFYNTQSTVRYVHFYNLTVAPTLGTSTPIYTVAIPPTSRVALTADTGLCTFSTGIEYQITTDDATVPASAGAAGDVVGTVMYA
jgi:hypothetical protein